jgi:hypothetical protein
VAVTRSASRQRHAVRRALQSKLLGYLRVVGAVAGKVNAELAQQFRMPPSNASQQALLTTGHKILELATVQKEVLVGLGMREQVLGELAAALGEFEQTLEALRFAQGRPSRAGRREHGGASADLKAVVAYDALASAVARRGGEVSVWRQRGVDGGVGQRPECVGAVQAQGW